ncbi:MAG: phosphatase PAP2 family protein [Clostridia bacterium]|nr:phosphatase PAP2 family protein [Clostridia bacterium]
MTWLNEFEVGLLKGLHDALQCTFLDKFFPLITSLGNAGIFWIIVAVVLLFFKKTRKAGVTMAISLILGLIICNLTMKPLIARIRPYDFDTSLQALMLIDAEHDFSFPSGHTVASIEAAVALWLNNKKWGTAAIVLAAVIAFSRLYLLVHYPTDVLAGVIIGVAIAFAAFALAKWLIKVTKMPCAD